MKKNFLVFMTDHQRGDIKDIYPFAVTPNMDRLKRNGIQFHNAYCTAPHCCPSRASFFSGLYPSEHGVWNNVNVSNTLSRGLFDNVRLFSEDMRDSGYQMFYSGKWHVSAEEGPENRGFDVIYKDPVIYHKYPNLPNTEEWERYKNAKKKMTDMSKERGEGEIKRPGYPLYTQYGINESPYHDREVVEAACKKIRDLETDRPFFMYVGALGPHDPYFVPQEFLDLYDINVIKLPENFNDSMEDKPSLYRRTKDRYSQLTEREHRESIRRYLAFCSYEDSLFGKLLDSLEEKNLLDDTIVIYVSDHGDYVGSHGLWAKGLPCFKEAYHIVSTIGYGGVQEKNQNETAMISIVDYAPTFLDYAGVKTDRHMAGKSLRPFLEGKRQKCWRDTLYTQSNGNELYGIQRAVFDQNYKYVFNGFDYDELYDLRKDPLELTNLLKEREYTDIVKEYCSKLWKFARENSDNIVNDYIMTAMVPFGPGIILDDNN